MNFPHLSDLPSDVYSIFPEPDRPIAGYVVPVNGRRCQTCPPWSVNDIGRRFNLRFGPDGHPPPRFYVDSALLRPYSDIRVMLDWHDSLVVLLDSKYVLKMMSPLFDVNTVVANMRRASSVVPVPDVRTYGRSGNCVFILMDYIEGWQASTLVRYFGPWVEVRLQDQIDDVILKLSQVGLAHNDLYPRNVFLDDDWKITGIIDWDYSAPLWASTEYERRSTLNYQEKAWHHLFLKHSVDRLGCLAANPSDGEFKYHHKPAPGRILSKEPAYKWALPESSAHMPAVNRSAAHFRIVVLVSGSVETVEYLATSVHTDVLPYASLSLVVSDEEHNSSFAELCETVGIRYTSIIPSNYRFDEFQRHVARNVVKARPDMVLLVNWQHAFGESFWRGILMPRTLSDFVSFPPVLGIRTSLPGHWVGLPNPMRAAYHAWRHGFGSTETGVSAYRVFPYQEVEFLTTRVTILDGEEWERFERRVTRNVQDFTVRVLQHLLERLKRYSTSKRLMDARFYGEGPRKWNRRQPLAEMFLYLDS